MTRTLIRWMGGTCARLGFVRVPHRDNDGRRQLLVDVSTIARDDARTGIQRVVRALWLELKSLEDDALTVTPVIASRRSAYRIAPADFLCRKAAYVIDTLKPVKLAKGDIFLGLDLAAHIVPFRARDFRRWHAHGVNLAFVVYDLLPVRHPHWFSVKGRRNYLRWIKVVLRQADQVICIADAVKQDLERWIDTEMGVHDRRPRIAVMRLSGDMTAGNPSEGLPTAAQDVFAWISESPTVLMVGTIEPRKGYDQALAAFERLWAAANSAAPKLAIVGRPGWMTDDLQKQIRQHPEHQRRLIWLDDVSDEYLAGIYARSFGLLFASRAEGFGLPLLEAASHGKPVLARDLQVFREFAPSSVTFFATDEPDDLAASITTWLSDASVSQSDLATLRLVSWRETADDLVDALGLAPGADRADRRGKIACVAQHGLKEQARAIRLSNRRLIS